MCALCNALTQWGWADCNSLSYLKDVQLTTTFSSPKSYEEYTDWMSSLLQRKIESYQGLHNWLQCMAMHFQRYPCGLNFSIGLTDDAFFAMWTGHQFLRAILLHWIAGLLGEFYWNDFVGSEPQATLFERGMQWVLCYIVLLIACLLSVSSPSKGLNTAVMSHLWLVCLFYCYKLLVIVGETCVLYTIHGKWKRRQQGNLATQVHYCLAGILVTGLRNTALLHTTL